MENQHGLETYEQDAGRDIQRFYDTVKIVKKGCSNCYGTGYDEDETCGRCQGLGFIELELDRDDIAKRKAEEDYMMELNSTYAL